MISKLGFTGAVVALVVGGCQNEAPPDDDGGRISLIIAAAPAGVGCVGVTVTGSTRSTTRQVEITTGVDTTTTLSALPTGAVSISANAFAETCTDLTSASNATWTSDAVMATLPAGATVPIQLVMRQGGRISLSIAWDTGETCTGCARLEVPLAAGGSTNFTIDLSSTLPNLQGATVTAHLCVFAGSAGSLGVFARNAQNQGSTILRQLSTVTRCDAGFSDLDNFDFFSTTDYSQTRLIGLLLAADAFGGSTSPTVIYVDSITVSNGATGPYTFTASASPLAIATDPAPVPGSALDWVGP